MDGDLVRQLVILEVAATLACAVILAGLRLRYGHSIMVKLVVLVDLYIIFLVACVFIMGRLGLSLSTLGPLVTVGMSGAIILIWGIHVQVVGGRPGGWRWATWSAS